MLIRAVAREELNRVLVRNWREAPASQNEWRVPALAFQIMVSSNSASSSLSRSNNYAALTESVIQDCFVHVARDRESDITNDLGAFFLRRRLQLMELFEPWHQETPVGVFCRFQSISIGHWVKIDST